LIRPETSKGIAKGHSVPEKFWGWTKRKEPWSKEWRNKHKPAPSMRDRLGEEV